MDKAVAATVSALEIYNKPNFLYRCETFSILAINGWELLLKAKWLREHRNNIRCLYVMEKTQNKDGSRSKRPRIKRTRSGSPMTHSLDHVARKLGGRGKLGGNVLANIQALLALRDSSIHFYNSAYELQRQCHGVGTASIENFFLLVNEWFEYDLSKFNLYLMPLSFVAFPSRTRAIVLNREERNFLKHLEQLEAQADYADSKYNVTINIDVKLVRTKRKEAVAVRSTNNPDAPEVRMTEEQVLERFPWDYQRLVRACRERYVDFKQNHVFHEIKRSLCEGEASNLCKIRLLDPKNVRSSSKQFYKPEILNEFDRHYSRETN